MEISLGKRGVTRPGKRLQFANLKIAIEFVDLPIKMVIFHSYVSLPEEVGQLRLELGGSWVSHSNLSIKVPSPT